MNEKIEAAIEKMAEMTKANSSADQALKFSQAVLNLAHARQILESVKRVTKD